VTSDDEEAIAGPASGINTDALGTIRVVMQPTNVVPRNISRQSGGMRDTANVVHSGALHERAKKTGGHIVS
jgi:hypothetical protein